MFRLVRWLVLPLAICAGLYAAADVTTRKVAEDRLAASIRDQFDMKQDPKVAIASFPFIYEALRKHRVTGATITASSMTVDELELRDVRVELAGIASVGFLSTSGITVTVDRVSARATVLQAALQRFLTSRGIRVSLTVREGSATATARRVIGGRTRTVTASGSVDVRGERLRFVPRSIRIDGAAAPAALTRAARAAVTFSVAIPELPGDVRPERVELHAGAVTLVAGATNARVRLGGERT